MRFTLSAAMAGRMSQEWEHAVKMVVPRRISAVLFEANGGGLPSLAEKGETDAPPWFRSAAMALLKARGNPCQLPAVLASSCLRSI